MEKMEKLKQKNKLMTLVAMLAIIPVMILSLLPFVSAATITNFTFSSLSTVGIMFAVIGVVVVIVALIPWTSAKVRVALGVAGVIILVLGLTVFSAPSSLQINTSSTGPTPAVTISSVASGAYTYTAATHTILIPVTANYTSKLVSTPTGGNVWFNFTVMRTDTNTTAAIFKLTSSWGTETNATTGVVAQVIGAYTNGTSEISFAGGQYGGTALYSIAAAGTQVISVHFVINPAAMLDLKQYGSTTVVLNIDGNVLNAQLILATLL